MEEENILHGPPDHISEFRNISLGQLMLNQLTTHGRWVAQIIPCTEEQQTYEEILNASRKLAVAFQREGLQKGDRIAICSENNLEFCIPVCAGFYLGVTLCPLNPLYSERELKHALSISRPKIIFVSAIGAKNMEKVLPGLPWSPKLVTLTETRDYKLPSIKSLTMDIVVDDNFRACSVDADDVVVISCSSGTTGLPKGVMLTNKNLLTMVRHFAIMSPYITNVNVTTLALLPFFHAYSFCVLLIRLIFGNKAVILSRFDEKLFLSCIEKYRIEHLTIVPPLMVFLAKHPIVDKYDLSCIKDIWCGAAPVSKEIVKTVVDRLNLPNIKQGYGLTETTLAVLKSPMNDTKVDSVGKLAPETSDENGNRSKIALGVSHPDMSKLIGKRGKIMPIDGDESSKPLGPNSVGELCFKGDLIMKGYCNDDSATASTIDKDGWLHSGDVGYYDEEGYFYIVDRLKELIKYKAFQVPPAELEALLLSCAGIKDAAVIGLPNEEAGELPAAFVVKQDGADITADDITKFVDERVSSHKRLRGGVRFVESIPKTASGKILRRELRDALKSKL